MKQPGAISREHGAGKQSTVGSRQFSARIRYGLSAPAIRHSSLGTCHSTPRAGAGFTLIELLVVVAVIAVLAGITLAAMSGVQGKAARDRTKAEISAIATALEAYRSQYGVYPPSASNNTVPFTNISGYLATDRITVEGVSLKDPFGADYVYVRPGLRNRASFDLYSTAGAGTNETHKHIGNW